MPVPTDPIRAPGLLDLFYQLELLPRWTPKRVAEFFGVPVPQRQSARVFHRIRYVFKGPEPWSETHLDWDGVNSYCSLVKLPSGLSWGEEVVLFVRRWNGESTVRAGDFSYSGEGLELQQRERTLILQQRSWTRPEVRNARAEVREDGLTVEGRVLTFGDRVRVRGMCGLFRRSVTKGARDVYAEEGKTGTFIGVLNHPPVGVRASSNDSSLLAEVQFDPATWEAEDGSLHKLQSFVASCHATYLEAEDAWSE